ncbi:transcription factor PRE3-like [Ipomoea triloba]|uniref:transcription factor PRE3-like n=1 Tax=Ipomoea triloba TaxID=35885 RepID=UPI00125DDCB8|nr:transcription factor PRE3-like [Ipomoea triloba]GMC72067.1 transcription factor PRE3-like [Ipomoea batatas]
MSSRRRSSSSSSASSFTEEEINALVNKLQALLPASTSRSYTNKVAASEIVEETCNYIKRLHREVDGLCERLSQILSSNDTTNLDLETLIRNLLQQ